MFEFKPQSADRHRSGKFSWLDNPRAILAMLALALVAAGAFLFYTQRAQLIEELHRDLAEAAWQKANRLSACDKGDATLFYMGKVKKG